VKVLNNLSVTICLMLQFRSSLLLTTRSNNDFLIYKCTTISNKVSDFPTIHVWVVLSRIIPHWPINVGGRKFDWPINVGGRKFDWPINVGGRKFDWPINVGGRKFDISESNNYALESGIFKMFLECFFDWCVLSRTVSDRIIIAKQ
jgi:hypothetical protein